MKVKICGITSSEDAAMCEDLGADALGFVYYPGKSRSISLKSISEIGASLGPVTSKVLVCKPSSVGESLSMLSDSCADALQLYSLGPEETSELRDRGVKVLRVVSSSGEEAERFAAAVDALVFEDGPPGRGASYDYSRIPSKLRSRAFIAGGLTPENVHLAVALKPYGVDVSSGVETEPGRKDPAKVMCFIKRCMA
jgi:phosphoribosylanthranilate isomerase